MLSNYYRNIELFRYSAVTGDIYIFASEDLQLVIDRQGKWDFIDEA